MTSFNHRLFGARPTALAAGVVALLIPQVLRSLVDGPLQTGDAAQVLPAFLIVLGLGVLEAIMVFLRRTFVLGGATALGITALIGRLGQVSAAEGAAAVIHEAAARQKAAIPVR